MLERGGIVFRFSFFVGRYSLVRGSLVRGSLVVGRFLMDVLVGYFMSRTEFAKSFNKRLKCIIIAVLS